MSIKGAVCIVAASLLLVVGLFVYDRNQAGTFDFLPAPGSAEERQVYMRAAELGDVFATASIVKMHMAEYYQMTGEYPRDNLELGIDPPYKFANDRVLDLSVTGAGEITIHFKQERGVFPAIRLTVDETLIKTGLTKWKCSAEHFSDALLAVMPHCIKYDSEAIVFSAVRPGDGRVSTGSSFTASKVDFTDPQKGDLARELAGHIKKGDDGMIERMLADGVVVDGEPIIAAVNSGRFDLVQQFLSMGADVNSIDIDGNSLLLAALFSNEPYSHRRIDLIRLLLNSGADINYVSPVNRTALLSLYIPERPDYLRSSSGVDDAEIRKYRVASEETYGVAKLLLDQGARLNVTAANNHSALSHAVWAGAGKLVELYMQRGASGDSWDGRQQYLLDIALKNGYAETALLLYEHGAQLELSEARYKSERMLILALQHNAKDVVDTMLALGADASRKVRFTTLGVVSAMEHGLVEQDWHSVLKFLEQGVEPPCKVKLYDSVSAERWPQATQGHRTMLPIFQYIVETGGAVQALGFMTHLNACDVSHDSALHYVLANDYAELVLPLIKAGASLEVRDQQGRSLFDASIERGDEASALAFFEHQELPESTDELQALWHRATEHGMTKLADEIGELLLAASEPEPE
ncbi:MAG: pilin [Granulosicoccus sp.]